MTYFPCYMRPDPYGLTTIRNLYYDSDHYRLIRRSIEKPVYKEKLRLRGYGNTLPDSPVFVELKKNYKKIVYKRRLSMSEREATAWLAGISVPSDRSLIACEIEYVLHYYESLHPVVFLVYDRSAYFGKEDATFRITFDKNIVSVSSIRSFPNICSIRGMSTAQRTGFDGNKKHGSYSSLAGSFLIGRKTISDFVFQIWYRLPATDPAIMAKRGVAVCLRGYLEACLITT